MFNSQITSIVVGKICENIIELILIAIFSNISINCYENCPEYDDRYQRFQTGNPLHVIYILAWILTIITLFLRILMDRQVFIYNLRPITYIYCMYCRNYFVINEMYE